MDPQFMHCSSTHKMGYCILPRPPKMVILIEKTLLKSHWLTVGFWEYSIFRHTIKWWETSKWKSSNIWVTIDKITTQRAFQPGNVLCLSVWFVLHSGFCVCMVDPFLAIEPSWFALFKPSRSRWIIGVGLGKSSVRTCQELGEWLRKIVKT